MASVIPSDEGLTLETSALKLFTVAIYIINSIDKLPCNTLPPMQHHSLFRNLPPLFSLFFTSVFSSKFFHKEDHI